MNFWLSFDANVVQNLNVSTFIQTKWKKWELRINVVFVWSYTPIVNVSCVTGLCTPYFPEWAPRRSLISKFSVPSLEPDAYLRLSFLSSHLENNYFRPGAQMGKYGSLYCSLECFKGLLRGYMSMLQGGIASIAIKGVLRIYFKQQQYIRQSQRTILDYDETITAATAAASQGNPAPPQDPHIPPGVIQP